MEMGSELRSLIRESLFATEYDYTRLDLLSDVTTDLDMREVFDEMSDRRGIE